MTTQEVLDEMGRLSHAVVEAHISKKSPGEVEAAEKAYRDFAEKHARKHGIVEQATADMLDDEDGPEAGEAAK